MPNAALSQKLKPSPKLAEILGSSQPLSRADANLRPLFGKDRITMFEVGRIVNSNLEGGNSSKKPPKKAA